VSGADAAARGLVVIWKHDAVTPRPPTDTRTVVFHAPHGTAVTAGVAALCMIGLVTVLLEDPALALRYAPALAWPVVVVWALYTRPAVIVSDAGVEVRNVTRTIVLPWPSIQRVDTKYALTLYTAYGTFAAWAAPAPSRMSTLASAPDDLKHLPKSSYIGGGVRPGDLTTSASGQAAAVIRRRWDGLNEAGHLADPRLERSRPQVRWHVLPALGIVALAALAVLLLRSG
jgi:hypothetical protein